jgi:hypothetical protein
MLLSSKFQFERKLYCQEYSKTTNDERYKTLQLVTNPEISKRWRGGGGEGGSP